MTLLSWSREYLIGDSTIDAEHQILFSLINQFHDRWTEEQDRQKITNLLTELIRYAEQHFQHEEAIMAAASFPLLGKHHEIHEKMVERIFTLRNEYETGDQHLEQDTLKFARNWLIEHIVNQDYLFRDFLARKPSR